MVTVRPQLRGSISVTALEIGRVFSIRYKTLSLEPSTELTTLTIQVMQMTVTIALAQPSPQILPPTALRQTLPPHQTHGRAYSLAKAIREGHHMKLALLRLIKGFQLNLQTTEYSHHSFKLSPIIATLLPQG